MDSLQIKTGSVSLEILDNTGKQRGIFTFNPKDVNLVKRALAVSEQINQKQKEIDKQFESASTIEAKVKILDDVYDYFNNLIDGIFGKGTCLILFGDEKCIEMYTSFFDGIAPYLKSGRESVTEKYRK